MFDLLITNGTVVTGGLTLRADVAVSGSEIQAVGKPGQFGGQARRVIDAAGRYVVPGAIDPHVHFAREGEGAPVPGIEVESVAAAHGGTTTFIDFAKASARNGLAGAIRERRQQFDGKTAIDYGLHVGISEPSWSMFDQIDDALRAGARSFKLYLHARLGTPADDGFILHLMKEVGKRGGIVAFHAENEALVSYHTNQLLQEGKTGVEYFSQSRPNVSEAEPVRSMIYLSRWAPPSTALYFFHLSSREALAEVREARAGGLPVHGETCPHYLAFNDEAYRGERGIQFIRFPPIRSAADQEALWQGVVDGALDCIGADHVTALLSVKREKSRGKPFTEMPGGMAHVENRLAYMFSEGCAAGRITVNRLVEMVSTNPARIFGLYPRKGTIAPGSDADIVLIDPNLKKKVTSADLHMGVDYTIYEGMTFTGWPVMTIARGKVIVENGRFLGSLTDGQFLAGR